MTEDINTQADNSHSDNEDQNIDEQLSTESATTDELTHVDSDGDAQMVNVGTKPDTNRRAVARGEIKLTQTTIDAVRNDTIAKGDVLSTARIGAIQAVKHTWETIPMCHQIPITNVDTALRIHETAIELRVTVETTGKTGCEMEALEGVTTGLNVIWDMVKATEKDNSGQYPETAVTDVEIVKKQKQKQKQE
ncbi:cyclic pyranopterin monophosphate synthase MoaC [Haloquadratum walsbyi]|uniref:Probable cyclic pyranopterin monophosphate synthase n=1 Tax=Haloquadratum walsbyi J07HQW2 TaxID=1238425 RepID=U1PLC5_9EURY|nr:cyclic pyranopterin monophosphate synthase MoaC [Haloquadratum walsbyi]ERG94497.1 MAG: molybdenum cofactor biosynthesis protein MoaC [Haloquadratum walsbyi J07HQW2]